MSTEAPGWSSRHGDMEECVWTEDVIQQSHSHPAPKHEEGEGETRLEM